MKNLKKLSVVLFATLLSFNFTSCIDDGVSDAVDQVYLAQAEFLKAQAALKDADAQKVLAEAAYEQAKAAVQTARAAGIDAMTANQLLLNEGQVEANALQAQKNVIFLAEEEAKLDVALQTQMNLLQAAQSEYEVAMVNLGEAVAAAKDTLILGYYGDYAVVTAELQDLYEEKIEAEHDLAVKELMMVAINNPVDMVSRAYYQAMLEAELAELEGELVAEEANLAALQAVTEADAGDPAKEITDLEAQIAVLQEQKDALVIEHAEALNAVDQAYEAWEASTEKYNDLNDAELLLKEAIAAKKEHTDQMAADTVAIAEHQDIIDVQIPAAEQAVADAVTAYGITISDLEAAQDALGEETTPAPVAGDDALTGTTLYDVLWNTQLAKADADQKVQDANDATYALYIDGIEFDLAAAEEALATYTPGTPIADLEAAVVAANAEEEAAQQAYELDPDGLTIDAGDDGVAGENQTTTGETWVQVTAYGLSGPTFGTVTYDSFGSVQLGEDEVDDPGTPADESVTSVAVENNTDGTGGWPVVTDIDGTMVGEWFNVEADDSDEDNVDRLWDARYDAYFAQSNLNLELNGVSSVTETRDDLLEEVKAAYLALGYVWGDATYGTPDYNDIDSVNTYITSLVDAAAVAQANVVAAQGDVTDAMTAIGTTFAEFDSPADWIELGSNDSVDSDDLNDNDPNTLFEEVQNALINWSIAVQELDALGTVAYNQGEIETLETELEELAALLPSHDYAIDYLQGEFDRLAALYNLDLTLWDLEGGHGLGQMLMDLPAFADYLDALNVSNDVVASMAAINAQISDLENLIDAYAYLQSGDFVTDGTNVADFMEGIADDIEDSMDAIDELNEDIEIQKGLVATGIVDKATAEAWVAEYQRRLDLIDTKIAGFESAAANLLARINALLN